MSGIARRDELRALANRIRAIPHDRFGLRPYTVTIVTGSWSGDYTGRGTETETEVSVTEDGQPPKVRLLNDERLALSGLPRGAVEIGPITPTHSTGGTALSSLIATALTANETIHLKLTGPDGTARMYVITSVKDDRALHYKLTAEPAGE